MRSSVPFGDDITSIELLLSSPGLYLMMETRAEGPKSHPDHEGRELQ